MEQVYSLLAASVTLVILSYLLPKPSYSRKYERVSHTETVDNVIHVDFKARKRVAKSA